MKKFIEQLARETNAQIKNVHTYSAAVYTGGLQEINAKIQKTGSTQLSESIHNINHNRRVRRYMHEIVANMKRTNKTEEQIVSTLIGYSQYYCYIANIIPSNTLNKFNSYFSPTAWAIRNRRHQKQLVLEQNDNKKSD